MGRVKHPVTEADLFGLRAYLREFYRLDPRFSILHNPAPYVPNNEILQPGKYAVMDVGTNHVGQWTLDIIAAQKAEGTETIYHHPVLEFVYTPKIPLLLVEKGEMRTQADSEMVSDIVEQLKSTYYSKIIRACYQKKLNPLSEINSIGDIPNIWD